MFELLSLNSSKSLVGVTCCPVDLIESVMNASGQTLSMFCAYAPIRSLISGGLRKSHAQQPAQIENMIG